MNVMVPRLKPVGADTWEIRAILAADEQSTNRISIEFPGPSTVVGAYCAVIQNSIAGDLIVPTIDDIMAVVDVDNRTNFTSGPTQGQTAPGSRGSLAVTLASLDSRYRDLYWDLKSARPVLGITFEWKREDGSFYYDALISVALITLPGSQEPRS